jgi:LPS-assembly protein
MLLRRCLQAFVIYLLQGLFTTCLAAPFLSDTVVTECQAQPGSISTAAFDRLPVSNIAKILGWVHDKNVNDLCSGYYLEPEVVTTTPNPLPYSEAPVAVTAKKPSFFSQYGASVLEGDVKINQPGREATADKVTIFRDRKTNKFSSSILLGNVHLRENGKVIVAQTGSLDFAHQVYSLNNAVYRLYTKSPTGYANVWGRSQQILSDTAGVLKAKNSSYSTCAPDNPTWQIWARDLVLDRNTGRGTAKHAYFYFKKMPLLYTPYMNFPIDKRRKSGFLPPSFGHSNDSGFTVEIPYYFNLAPNYDLTIAPQPYSKSGLMLNSDFRYLTSKRRGYLKLAFIPHDSAFVRFRDNASTQFLPTPNTKHALSQLQNASDWRGSVSFQDTSTINQHWSSAFNVNRVSDDYFLQNFGNAPAVIDNDQLLNQADIKYSNDNWRFLGRLQDFQTLHPLLEYQTQDQYRRLPQLDLIGNYPNIGKLAYRFESEFVSFEHRNNFVDGTPVVVGRRLHLMPEVSLPISSPGRFFIPKIQLDVTNYALRHNNQGNFPQVNSLTRWLPLFSIDSGLILNREMNFGQHSFTQTLEPRLFYLFVPFESQGNIQNFDTTLPPLDFNQFFRTNRFSGIDCIGDANQFAAGLTTRFLNSSGEEKLNLGIAEVMQLHRHRIQLQNFPDPLASESFSPLVGQLQYFMTRTWSASANAAWDPHYQQLDTGNANLRYQSDQEHIANFWYNFSRNGDLGMNLNRIGFAFSWTIYKNWNLLGDLDFNISRGRSQNYFYGIEYNTCCWAVRFVQSQVFQNVNSNGNNTYSRQFYLQFLLKGLGNFGTNGTGGLLAGQIPNYQDKFAMGARL